MSAKGSSQDEDPPGELQQGTVLSMLWHNH